MEKHELIENNILILSKQTMDLFLAEENPADLIAVYLFYYHTAKWQGTNQPKATDTYVRKGLKLGRMRVEAAQKVLIRLGLIERVITKKERGKFEGWYMKIKYIWKAETEQKVHLSEIKQMEKNDHLSDFPHVDGSTSGQTATNALSVNNLNALSVNNQMQSVADESATHSEKDQEKKPENPHRAFIRLWDELTRSTRGVAYIFHLGDAKALKWALGSGLLTVTQLEQLALYFLADSGYRKFGPSIRIFLSQGVLLSVMNDMQNRRDFWKKVEDYYVAYMKKPSPETNQGAMLAALDKLKAQLIAAKKM